MRLDRLIRCAGLALLAVGIARQGWAAEIRCINHYGQEKPSSEIISKLWPSGFRPNAGMCQAALVEGIIENGDYEKLRSFFHDQYKTLNVLWLHSAGGDLEEAMKIGRMFRSYLISAFAPLYSQPLNQHWLTNLCNGPECICASACAIAWFGAVERYGDVGLHRPSIRDPAFKVLSPPDSADVYRRVLSDTAAYLRGMEVPQPLIDAMVSTGSSEIHWVDAEANGLTRPPSYAEAEDAACGSFTAAEGKTFDDLRRKPESALSERETLLFRFLSEKEMKIRECKLTRRFSYVDQLPPP